LTAAIRREKAFLRATFGDTYDRYQSGEGGVRSEAPRRFSAARAIANGEHRAVIGRIVGAALLMWRVS